MNPHTNWQSLIRKIPVGVGVNAIILAGGKSSRMGFDKAFIPFKGLPLIKQQVKLLKKIFKKIIIVTNAPEKYKFRGATVVSDIIKGCGPLSGLHAGLMASDTFYNFVVACDMPFLNQKLLRYLCKNPGKSDLLVPKIKGRVHPLVGIYSKKCLDAIEGLLESNDLKVLGLVSKVKSSFLGSGVIKKFDPQLLSLENINTPDDLLKIR